MRRRRPEPGVAPRRPERCRTGRRRPASAPKVPMAGTPPVIEAAGADDDQHEESEERDRRPACARRRTRSRPRCATASPMVRSRVSVCRWCARNALSRAVLETCSSRSSESCTRRSCCARRRDGCRRAHVQEVGEPAADGGPRPARMPGEQVAERLDEADHEPERHQPQQPPERVRREQHPHARAGRARTRRAGRRGARSSAASRCATRASGATRTRAPASRARQQRSRSSAPGNVAGSKPSSSSNRSVRTNIAAVVT